MNVNMLCLALFPVSVSVPVDVPVYDDAPSSSARISLAILEEEEGPLCFLALPLSFGPLGEWGEAALERECTSVTSAADGTCRGKVVVSVIFIWWF